MEIRLMSEVTRGRVDNENNSQSQYSNILNNIHYIYKSESIAIRNRKYQNMGQNTGKQCVQQGKHRNAMLEHGTGTGTRVGTRTGTGTKL